MLILDRKYKSLKSSGFIGKDTGKKYRIKFTSEKLRYINLFSYTSPYNTYKKGFLSEENLNKIELGDTSFIIEPLGREILAIYLKKRDNINEDFLRTEDLEITLIKGLEDKLGETERITKVVDSKRDEHFRRDFIDFYVKEKKLFVNKTEDTELLKEKQLMPKKYEVMIDEILQIEDKATQEQMVLNLMYFSYFFEILKTEDLKNEQYLELIWLAKDNKEDKPQKKVRGHKNLDLMYELLKWIDKARVKDFLFIQNINLINILEKLTEDNLYFLQMYLTHPEKDFFNYNKFEKKQEHKDLIQKALDKFMRLTSYKYKEQLALNFNYIKVMEKFVSGTERNEMLRIMKKNKDSVERKREAGIINAQRRQEEQHYDINTAKEGKLQEIREKLKDVINKERIYEILEENKGTKIQERIKVTRLKKNNTKGTIEKLLSGSKIIKIAKSIEEISDAGRKATCCLHENGLLSTLAKWIANNNQMVCLHGNINNKNFQILSYLRININNYSRTLVLDNIEANEKLSKEEYNILLKELKTRMRGYGIVVGRIRTDVEGFKEETSKEELLKTE